MDEKKVRSKNNSKTYRFKCPRCEGITHLSSGHPYCPGCNWDSLTDEETESKFNKRLEYLTRRRDEKANALISTEQEIN
jgi:hypothetical protein